MDAALSGLCDFLERGSRDNFVHRTNDVCLWEVAKPLLLHITHTQFSTGMPKTKCLSKKLVGFLWTVAYQLLCLWNFPGKNAEVGNHRFSRASSWPRDGTRVSCTVLDSSPSETPGECNWKRKDLQVRPLMKGSNIAHFKLCKKKIKSHLFPKHHLRREEVIFTGGPWS